MFNLRNKIGLINLNNLQIGTYKRHWREGDSIAVEFIPLGGFGKEVIRFVNPESFKIIQRPYEAAGTYGQYACVFMEQGKSWFVENYLRDELAPELFQKLQEVTKNSEMKVAAAQIQKRLKERGDHASLKEKMKEFQTMKTAMGQSQDPLRRRSPFAPRGDV